jgi:hypothetical protein
MTKTVPLDPNSSPPRRGYTKPLLQKIGRLKTLTQKTGSTTDSLVPAATFAM